jgi:hypothetical protein
VADDDLAPVAQLGCDALVAVEPPEALWTSAISAASQIRRSVRGGSGRSFQA